MSYERDNNVPQWQHVPLQVPWFSNDELPVKDPAPLTNFSIGEEISPSVPIAISWSPPGLAKYRRCALAVLTSNLVLSIWSAEGKLHEESSWNRRLLINDALTDYFSTSGATQVSRVAPTTEEQLRLRTRLRSFAWSPALPTATNTMGTQPLFDRQWLVVGNDDNQLVVMAVESPTSTFGSTQSWKATVLMHMTLEPEEECMFTDPLFFDDLMKQQRFISHVAWSPWIPQGNGYQSVIVYATNEEVRGRVITCTDDELKPGVEVIYPGINLRFSGAVSWCPKLKDDEKAVLALFTSSGLSYLTISIRDASIVDNAEHDLDGRWDQISGTAWDYENQWSPRLHFSSLLTTVQSPTAVVEESSGGLKSVKAPNWKEKIENSVVLFSVKNDLKGYSKTKVWGLTASPLGDFIASCNSLHPSDSIEYGPPADRRGTIALSTLRQYSKIRESFPHRNTTAEGVLFTLKKLVENTVEDVDQMPAFAEDVINKLLLVYKPIDTTDDDFLVSELDDLNEYIRRFKIRAMFSENSLRDRYSILVAHACNDTGSNELARTLISYRLAIALEKLSPALAKTAFSKEVLSHHKQLVALIESLFLCEDTDMENTDRVEAEQSAARRESVSMNTDDIADSTAPSLTDRAPSVSQAEHHATAIPADRCDLCSALIPFTDLNTATCANGHQFPRCGISLIAIQAPGITKYCGICSTPFLSEAFVQAQEAGEGLSVSEPKATLARVLFQTCDVCVFCGGKFVG